MSLSQPASNLAKTSLRFASRSFQPCPQCFRSFSSYNPAYTASRRQLQTTTHHQPQTFQPPPPPPRASFDPSAPVTPDTGSKPQAARTLGIEEDVTGAKSARRPQTDLSQAASSNTPSQSQAAKPKKDQKPRRFNFQARKKTITLSNTAVEHLKELLDQPEPKLIRIGTRNRGCSGLAYDLQYVDQPGKFDETVEQDGVKVLIDSKALMNIIGSEMDWHEDKLSARFVFKNPNITEQCGCGESFSIS